MSEGEKGRPSLMIISIIFLMIITIICMIGLTIYIVKKAECQKNNEINDSFYDEEKIVSYDENKCHTYANRVWCINE